MFYQHLFLCSWSLFSPLVSQRKFFWENSSLISAELGPEFILTRRALFTFRQIWVLPLTCWVPWASHTTSLGLSFFICKMETILISTFQGNCSL